MPQSKKPVLTPTAQGTENPPDQTAKTLAEDASRLQRGRDAFQQICREMGQSVLAANKGTEGKQ